MRRVLEGWGGGKSREGSARVGKSEGMGGEWVGGAESGREGFTV